MVSRTDQLWCARTRSLAAAMLALAGAIVLAQDAAPTAAEEETASAEDLAVSPENWHWSVRVEDLAPFPCAHGFRDRFATLLNHPSSRIAIGRDEFTDLLIAFEQCMTFRDIESPRNFIRDVWFRALRDGSFQSSQSRTTFHPSVFGTMASMLSAYTVSAPGSDGYDYRTLFEDGRVIDFRAGLTGVPPAVFADGTRVVVLKRGADTEAYTMSVYEDDTMEAELWRTRVETNLIVPPEIIDGRTVHHAWCRRSGERYLVFGVHPDGFYVHLYAADTGDHVGGYAYHADPYSERGALRAEDINDEDPEYAGRAW